MNDYFLLRDIIGNVIDCPGKGGNISVKCDGALYIKASGEDLKNPSHQFSTVINGKYDIKPSMEIKFHSKLKSKYVAHYHPVYLLPYLCSDHIFDGELGETVVEYFTPGEDLFNAIPADSSQIIFLKNHGVIIHSDQLSEIKESYDKIKHKYKIENNKSYTPDDYIDVNSDELWLFRMAMENIANKLSLNISEISKEHKMALSNNEDEKYRRSKM